MPDNRTFHVVSICGSLRRGPLDAAVQRAFIRHVAA